jgi:broad specificity phosphatase PhoE
MKSTLLFIGLLAAALLAWNCAQAQDAGNSSPLANAVILIIRHAEKPDSGSGLAPAGKKRAKAYVDYFRNYTVDGQPLKLDYLFASADSKASRRARLTIEPTSKKLGLSIDTRFEDAQYQKLATEIRTKPHGKNILICWHHGEIPQLIQALGGNSSQLFRSSKWPDAVFNWVIQLRYDGNGNVLDAKRITEDF